MFEPLLMTTAFVVTAGAAAAYRRTRDILHPTLVVSPPFLYSTVIEPWLVRDQIDRFFPYRDDIEAVLILYLLGATAFIIGALQSNFTGARRTVEREPVTRRDRVILLRIAVLLATIGLVAYVYGILNVGGFVAAFSRAKGGGQSESGYISEALNLGLVSAALVALSGYRRGLTPGTFAVLLAGVLPNLVQGTFGGRRGPLFVSLFGLIVVWLVTRRTRPRLLAVMGAFAGVFLLVALIWSQRAFLYLGSDKELDWSAFQTTLALEEVSAGNNFIYGAGLVSAIRHSGQFTWGHKLAVNIFIRPIPKQLWPTKYEDVDATWVTNEYPGLAHLTTGEWMNAVGWLPLQGSAAISITDLFAEFSWGAVVVMYLLGRGFYFLRSRGRSRGGVWDLLYFEALVVSIYLATQSFSAFYHRYLIMALPTIVVYRLWVRRTSSAGGRRMAHSDAVSSNSTFESPSNHCPARTTLA